MNNIKEIGRLLQKTRLEKSIDLSKVSTDLKIRKQYLEFLENGEYKNIPGKTYIKGYIKMYSDYLSIGDEIEKMHTETKPERKKFYSGKKIDDNWALTSLFTILVIVLAILIWYQNASTNYSNHNIINHLNE